MGYNYCGPACRFAHAGYGLPSFRGRAKLGARNPYSQTCGYGFRTCRCAAIRNDGSPRLLADVVVVQPADLERGVVAFLRRCQRSRSANLTLRLSRAQREARWFSWRGRASRAPRPWRAGRAGARNPAAPRRDRRAVRHSWRRARRRPRSPSRRLGPNRAAWRARIRRATWRGLCSIAGADRDRTAPICTSACCTEDAPQIGVPGRIGRDRLRHVAFARPGFLGPPSLSKCATMLRSSPRRTG